MTSQYHRNAGFAVLLSVMSLTLAACGPRVIISTGTTIGLKATPGDGSTRPPQVTFAYKRTEFALVPTGEHKATARSDAFSTLAAINFYTKWFGETKIRSLLGTGMAARAIQGESGGTVEGDAQVLEMPANSASENSSQGKHSPFWRSFEGINNKLLSIHEGEGNGK